MIIIPFNLRDIFQGTRHWLVGIQRKIFSISPEHYLKQLQKQGNSNNFTVVLDDFNKPLTCRRCGFAIMSYRVSGKIDVEACSYFAGYLFKQDQLDRLESIVNTLPEPPHVKEDQYEAV